MSLPPDSLSALIPAAGSGERMGGCAKAFLESGGATLLERAVERACAVAGEVLVGLRAEELERGETLLSDRPVGVHLGGPSRHDTIRALLARSSRPWILVHDAARPFASPALFAAVIAAAAEHGAAVPGLPASPRDALARRDGDFVVGFLSRDEVVLTQTPVVVRRDLLEEAFRMADGEAAAVDSFAHLLGRAGHRLRLVPGEPENLKVTFPEDWALARDRLL